MEPPQSASMKPGDQSEGDARAELASRTTATAVRGWLRKRTQALVVSDDVAGDGDALTPPRRPALRAASTSAAPPTPGRPAGTTITANNAQGCTVEAQAFKGSMNRA